MAKKIPGQPADQPQSGKSEKKTNSEHLGSEVRVTLHPAEFFKGTENQETLGFCANDQYVLAYHENVTDKTHRYMIFDSEGSAAGNLNVPFAVTMADVCKNAPGGSYAYGSKVEKNKPSNIVNLAKHFPNFIQNEIIHNFDKNIGADQSTYIANLGEAQKNKVMANPRAQIAMSVDGNNIVLLFGGAVYWMPVKNKDGVSVSIGNLRIQSLVLTDHSAVSKAVAENPWLVEFTEKRGEHISNTDLCVRVENNILNINHEHKATRVYSDAAVDYALDPLDPKKLYYAVPESQELRVIDTDRTEPHITVETKKLPLTGAIKEFLIDVRGNFFLVLMEDEGASTLHILEKDSLVPVAEIKDVKGKVCVDSIGNIYFIDVNGKLRVANTNFSTYEKGGLAKARDERRQKLIELQKKLGKGIKLPDSQKITDVDPAALEEEKIVRKLSTHLDTLFDPLITKAATLADIDTLEDQIQALKLSDDFRDQAQVFFGVDMKVRAKEMSLKVDDLQAQLAECESSLQALGSIRDLLDVERLVISVRKCRRDIVGIEPAQKRELDDRIRDVEVQVATQRSALQGECSAAVGRLFGEIESTIATMQSVEELNHFVATDQGIAEFEELTGYLDAQQASMWRQRYRDVLLRQNTAIQEALKREEEQENFRIARTLEEANEILNVISETIDGACDTVKKFDKWMLQSNNPIITRYRAKLLSVPDSLRHEQEDKLDELLKAKRRDLEHRQALQISHDRDEVDFGKHTFPLFRQVQAVWQPKIRPLSEGSEYGHLTFEDNLGHIYRVASGAILRDMFDDATRETIDAYKGDAAKYFESLKREVPAYNEKWVMSEYIRDHLGKMAKLLKLQMEHQRGIMILEGEAGTGKNVLVDMFCHFTNREAHTFSCNFQTEKEDITYAFKYDPGKGTYNVDSRLIEMLQTPGAVIILDEINALPSGVAKMLNPLLDYRRCLYLPDGRVIKAHPSVLILGTMNPQHYIGVKPLSQEVKTRARIMSVDYPPFQTSFAFAYDEALMLSRYVDSLKDLKDSEFVTLWNYAINGDSTNGGDKFITPERGVQLHGILTILKSAQKVREAYKAFRTGTSADPIEFVFSMRETIDITTELNGSDDVKAAIKDVILPKVSDPLEQKSIETIIDNV